MKYIKSIPLVLFLSFSGKFLITGVNYPEVITLLGLATLVGFFEYKEQTKEITKLKKENEEIRKDLAETSSLVKNISDHISGQKVAQAMKFGSR